MLDVFADRVDLQNYRDEMVETGNMRQIEFTTTWLQGENWLVRSTEEDVAAMQEILGGNIKSITTGPNP